LVISKGTDPAVDAYSGFDGPGLTEMLRAVGVDRLVIGGLATDYCVRATALAAQEEGFEIAVVVDAVRAVDVHAGDGEQALKEMRSAGISLQTLAETAAEETR